MSDFKATPKMKSDLPCYKEGGSIQRQVENFTKRDRKQVEEVNAPAKKVVKKAIGMHDTQQHEEKTDLSSLKKGGRAKKESGTVRKFKVGGSVDNEYSAKKASGDLDRIAKVKDIKPGKADVPNAATKRPAFKGSDVAKEKNKPAGDAVSLVKVKPTGDKKANAKSGAKGPDAYKCGGKIKKYAAGGQTLQDLMQAKELARLANARKYLGAGQQGQFAGQEAQQTPAMTGLPPAPAMAGQNAPAPAPMPAPVAQKRGGKAGKC